MTKFLYFLITLVILIVIAMVILFAHSVVIVNSGAFVTFILLLMLLITIGKLLIESIRKAIEDSKPKVSIAKQLTYKHRIRSFFEGYDDNDPYRRCSRLQLGVTDMKFECNGRLMHITITLESPGILIGKGGSTISALERHLSTDTCPVKIHIVESKLWRE